MYNSKIKPVYKRFHPFILIYVGWFANYKHIQCIGSCAGKAMFQIFEDTDAIS